MLAHKDADWRTWYDITSTASINMLISKKWSSQGGNVNLIDRDDKQLKDANHYVEQMRNEHGRKGMQPGNIHTYQPGAAKDALQASWLVLEVSLS